MKSQSLPFEVGTVGLVVGLMNRAMPNLTDDDLSAILRSEGEASELMRQVSALCNGLGCLVAGDKAGGCPSGSFQTPYTLASLLFLIGNAAEHAVALDVVATMARNQQSGGAA